MAFKKVGSLNPEGAPVLRRVVIANSQATVIGDSLKVASGFATAGTAGALVFGHLVSHSTSTGVGVGSTGVAGAAFGSYVGSYTAASDNQTVAGVTADMDISKFSLYSGEMSAAIGTTTGSNLTGYKIDLTDKDTLDESSTITATAQYTTWGVDPSNSAQGIVNIYESQVFGV